MPRVRYRSILVENEEHSLSRLRRLVHEFPQDVEVVGEAQDGPSAVEVIRALTPDLVFLDIDLPGLNGFQVLAALDEQPAVIFTTAYNQHALDAFRTHAIDYLLKPIDGEAMQRALNKLQAMRGHGALLSRAVDQLVNQLRPNHLTRLPCRIGDRTVLVKIGEVHYFQADNKYTSVRTAAREYLIDTPLIELERRLSPDDFIRIHRSTIVNVAWIAEIRRWFDGKLKVVLNDATSTELLASRMYADRLRSL
jgi:two-component system LytT family response regulator